VVPVGPRDRFAHGIEHVRLHLQIRLLQVLAKSLTDFVEAPLVEELRQINE